MKNITIRVSQKPDGIIYTLSAESSDSLEESMPSAEVRKGKVFISYESKQDFENTHSSVFQQVVQILTGLSLDRLGLSGFQVQFINTKTGEEIRENVAV